MRLIYLSRMLVVISFVMSTCVAHATVLTFDDLPPETIFGGGDLYFGLVPDTYGGLGWSANSAYFNAAENGGNSGFSNSVVSGDRVFAPISLVGPIVISGETFDFAGAYFTAAWRDGLNINIKGYAGQRLLYDDTTVIDTAGAAWIEVNQLGVDRLEISSFGGVYNPVFAGGDTADFAMDNFTFNVPEPSVILLLSMGMLIFGFTRSK